MELPSSMSNEEILLVRNLCIETSMSLEKNPNGRWQVIKEK